ncbi:MAG: DMT family transporter [Planctomycetes bacterium]|nr:DMT family transporter [Planctomycetota bacterium]
MMLRGLLLLLFGTLACSTAAIIIKMSEPYQTDPILLASFRCLIASVILSPLYFRDRRAHRDTYKLKHLGAALLPGVFMGLHFISWNFGVVKTAAANATLLVTMTPITMPFFAWIIFRQKLNRAEWAATTFSVIGVVILMMGDLELEGDNLTGDLLSLLSLLLLTYYLILARVNRSIGSIWLYIVPLYFISGSFCLLCSLFFTHPFQSFSVNELYIFLALALIPTVTGHSILNYSMRHLPSQLVAIVSSGQFIFTGILAYIIHNETIHGSFLVASVLVVIGVVVAVRARKETAGDDKLAKNKSPT